MGRGELGTASSLQALRDLSRSACARSSSHVAAFRPCWAAGACASERPQTGPAYCARSCASWGQNKRFCICLMWPTAALRVSQNVSQSSSKWTQKPSVCSSRHGARSRSNRARPARWTLPWLRTPPGGRTPEKLRRWHAHARACTARATTPYPGTRARSTTKKNYQQQQKQPKCESVAAATATAAVAAAAANSNNSGAGSSNKSNRVRAGSESSSNSCKTKRKQLQQQQKR